jgi:precorrin-6B methylase 2
VGLDYLKDYSQEGIANINLEVSASSVSVDKFAHGDFYDVIGNVWQWTTSPIQGFDGFEVHPLYDDFSVPTFDTRHNIIKGGSWISTGNEVLLCARYAFRRHFFQHAGFRYVEVDTISHNTFGLGNSGFILEDQKSYDTLFDKLAGNIDLSKLENVLNIGCHYGGLVFDIHKANKNIHITGIDFTARNIMIADQNLKAFDYENIEFWQGDSCNLKKHFSGYDLIIVTNPFEEIYEFETMVNELISRLNPSGKIVFAFRTDFDVEMVKDLLKNKKIESYVWQILTK